MKLFLIGILTFVLFGCAGPGNSLPSYSVQFKSPDGKVQLVDRKVLKAELDVTQGGRAILRVKLQDLLQIDKRTYEIPWEMEVSIMEGVRFRILKK